MSDEEESSEFEDGPEIKTKPEKIYENVDENSNLQLQKGLMKLPQMEMKSEKKRYTYQVMVDSALIALKEIKGSSIIAIKKYILQNFPGISENRTSFMIRKYIKKAIDEGKIKQIKGKFKLIKEKTTAKKKTAVKKMKTVKKPATKSKPKQTMENPIETAKKPEENAVAEDNEMPTTSKKAAMNLKADQLKNKLDRPTGKQKKIVKKLQLADETVVEKAKITKAKKAKATPKKVIPTLVPQPTKASTKKSSKSKPKKQVAAVQPNDEKASQLKKTRAKPAIEPTEPQKPAKKVVQKQKKKVV